MDDRIRIIEKKVNNIEILLIKLSDKIDQLNEKLSEDVLPECQKMGSHIDFVENVYETVKYPLGYLCNKVKTLTGYHPTHSLTIENQDAFD